MTKATETAVPEQKSRHSARATKTPERAVADGAGEVAQFDASAILEEMRAMRNAMQAMRDENATLRTRLEAAEQKASEYDEYGLKNDALAGIGVTNVGTEKVASIEEKLNCMARLAKQQKEPFDRERTRRILMGQPVEDLDADAKCNVCGKTNPAWAVEEVLAAHEVVCAKKRENAITRANAV